MGGDNLKSAFDMFSPDEPAETEPTEAPVVENHEIYSVVREDMRTGDIIACAGDGKFSKVIVAATGLCKNNHPVSHVAIVLREYDGERDSVVLIESTIERGVALTKLSDLVENYEGDLWWYPVKRDIPCRPKAMRKWLRAQKGKEYDLPQAIVSALDFVHPTEDFERLFCSELAAEALERGGVIKEVVASSISPAELIDDYFEIWETPSLLC